MERSSMAALLRADEEKLRGELRADSLIDKNRVRSMERLQETFGSMLLRYNAACADDALRQSAADCTTAAVCDMLGLMTAGTVTRSGGRRRLRTGAVVLLLFGLVCALAGALVMPRVAPAGWALLAVCAVCCFFGGRILFEQEALQLSPGLDAENVWRVLQRTAETMDRKIDMLCEQENARVEELAAQRRDTRQEMDPEELKLFAALLEALYADNGDYSLRQLKKLRPYLQQRGIVLMDYTAENASLFELLPTKKASATLRPAILAGEKLLLPGRAAEHTD